MVNINDFLLKIQEIANEKPTYLEGQDGKNGTCDCIGLIIGAYRRSGGNYKGNHGSNWAARNEMQGIGMPFTMELGAIVYKAHLPGEKGWKLPPAYKDHPDQKDYYHVGVVTSIAPLQITHCTKSATVDGITVDTKIGVWRYGGRFDGLSYDNIIEEGPIMANPIGRASVIATSGTTVRMRAEPNSAAPVIAHIPLGTIVDIMESRGDWQKIQNGSVIGWMMTAFLKGADEPAEPSTAEKIDILWAAYKARSGA